MKQGHRNLFVFLSLAALVLSLVVTSQVGAQAISGDVMGVILDKSGAGVPNATVEAVSTTTGVKYPTKANANGEYHLTNLPVGTYHLSASAANFATTTFNNFKVDLNRTITQNITLEISGAVTTVEVSGAAPALDVTTPTLSTTFELQQLDLPNTNANGGSGVLNLSLLTAGVANAGAIGAGSGPAIGGQRPRNNNFTVEGVDNNSKGVTGPLVPVPSDSIAEFTVLQNQYSPEFGHSNGGQFNYVLKSGTNQFHGLAYEYFQNRNLNAIDAIVARNTVAPDVPKNPRFDNNRFGGNIGGPILKNKLFFFGSAQYNPVGQATLPGSVVCTPTAAGYTTIDGITGLSSTNLGVFKTYATPAATGSNCPSAPTTDPAGNNNTDTTQAASPACPQYGCVFVTNPAAPLGFTGVDVGVLPVVAPNYINNLTWLAKLDYNISSVDQVRGAVIFNDTKFIDNAATLPVFYQLVPGNINRLVTLNEYHTFTPSISNELRVGFNRSYYNYTTGNFTFPGLDAFPNLSYDELGLNIGPDGNAPQYAYQNLYTLGDNLTWSKGRHTLKFGVEGRKYISPQFFTQRARGDYEWATLDGYLRDITPETFAERSSGTTVYYGDQSAIYWYANDSWRIRSNLTINLGVRYEYTTIQTGERAQKLNIAASVPGLISFEEPRAPKNNWGPRIGIAYSPGSSGNTSIRAGFAIGYDVLYDNIGSLSLPPQQSGTADCPGNPSCPPSNAFLKNGGIPSTTPVFTTIAEQRAATASQIRVDQIDPQSITWTLGVQHSFPKNLTAEVRYVGTSGIHLDGQTRLNAGALINNTVFLPTYITAPSQATLDALPYVRGNPATATTPGTGIAGGAYSTPANGLPIGGDTIVPAYDNAGFNGSYVVSFQPNGHSTYHGLATQLTKRMSNGLQFVASYTFSKTIDDSTADFFSTILTPRRPQDFQNLKADRANSAIDHRNRFTLALIYDLPYFKHGNWIEKNLVGNWQLSPIYTYQTAQWMTVQSATDANGNGDSAGDRAIFNPAGAPGTGSAVTALFNTNTCAALPAAQQAACFSNHTVAYLASNPNAQYIRLGTYARANAGRNTLKGQAINDWDFSISKKFDFTERLRLQFTASAYNLFNHPQFNPGYLNDVTSISFTNGNVRTFLNPAGGTFNDIQSVFPSNARTMQLGLRFTF